MRRLEILLGENFLLEKLMAGFWVTSDLCGIFLVAGVTNFLVCGVFLGVGWLVGFLCLVFFSSKGTNRIELSISK